jgi:hypothetical protein
MSQWGMRRGTGGSGSLFSFYGTACIDERIPLLQYLGALGNEGAPRVDFYARGFGSYCHDRSGQQTKTGNNETKSPTRKPDVCGTQIHLPTWCPGHPLS